MGVEITEMMVTDAQIAYRHNALVNVRRLEEVVLVAEKKLYLGEIKRKMEKIVPLNMCQLKDCI